MFKKYYLIYIRRESIDGNESKSPLIIQKSFIFRSSAKKRMKKMIQLTLDKFCKNPSIPMDVKIYDSFAELMQENETNSIRIQIYLSK